MRRPCPALLCVAAAVLGPSASACGDARPSYTLQQSMFEVDRARLQLQGALSFGDQVDEARASLTGMQEWMRDPALVRYIESDRFPGNRERFDALMQSMEQAMDRLGSDLDGGDLDGARSAFASVEAACADCHAVYRPDLR